MPRMTYTPDEVDEIIIREKTKDAYTPARAIAPLAGVTEQTVLKRFNRLVDRRVIRVNVERVEAA